MSTVTSDRLRFESAQVQAGVRAVDAALLIVRFALGIIFIAHGGQKLFGWFGGRGLEATVSGFAGMGIPVALGYLAALTEFFGGIAVVIGLLSRLASLGLATTMIVAIALVHGKNGFFLSDQGYEFNLALLAMALAVAIAGPGRIALSDWETRLIRRDKRAV